MIHYRLNWLEKWKTWNWNCLEITCSDQYKTLRDIHFSLLGLTWLWMEFMNTWSWVWHIDRYGPPKPSKFFSGFFLSPFKSFINRFKLVHWTYPFKVHLILGKHGKSFQKIKYASYVLRYYVTFNFWKTQNLFESYWITSNS